MREHQLERTEGLTYAQMGRFMAAANPDDPKGTSDEEAALKDEEGNAISNPARQSWVTAVAITTALNTSYMAEQLSIFGMVVGVALLLTGIGLVILAFAVFGREPAAATDKALALGTAGNELIRESTGGLRIEQLLRPPGATKRAAQPPSSRAFGTSPQVESAASPMLASRTSGDDEAVRKEDAMKVEQIMTHDVLTIGPEARDPRRRQDPRRARHLRPAGLRLRGAKSSASSRRGTSCSRSRSGPVRRQACSWLFDRKRHDGTREGPRSQSQARR